MDLQENLATPMVSTPSNINKTSMRKNVITPKLVAALDRCQLSMRNSVFIIEATIETLGYNTDEFRTQRIRTKMRKERAEIIKIFA